MHEDMTASQEFRIIMEIILYDVILPKILWFFFQFKKIIPVIMYFFYFFQEIEAITQIMCVCGFINLRL